jgi:uncharacterized protein YndB with AHSA1/START domain
MAWSAGLTMILETFEPRNGGLYRYVHQDKYDNEHAFHGVNHEVSASERIIGTLNLKGFWKPGKQLFFLLDRFTFLMLIILLITPNTDRCLLLIISNGSLNF